MQFRYLVAHAYSDCDIAAHFDIHRDGDSYPNPDSFADGHADAVEDSFTYHYARSKRHTDSLGYTSPGGGVYE